VSLLNSPGLEFDSEAPLVGRALELIRGGPRSTPELAREVFDLTHAPPGLAARLVYDLLGGDRRVAVSDDGVWSVASECVVADALAATIGDSPRLSDLEFAVVDVETTGSTGEDRVMEIACVHVAGGSIGARYSTLVDPGCWIPPYIRRMTGIDEAMVGAAPRFEEIAGVVRRALLGRVFVAHNARFDWRFVAGEMLRSSAEVPVGDRLCTVRFAKRILPGLRRYGLDSLIDYYDLECRARHRAWGDALVTAEVLLRLLEAADRRGVETWAQLERLLTGQPARAR
jgi:DNA polymerase-3 subunit epsilon